MYFRFLRSIKKARVIIDLSHTRRFKPLLFYNRLTRDTFKKAKIPTGIHCAAGKTTTRVKISTPGTNSRTRNRQDFQ